MTQSVFVAGHNGLVGSAIVRRLSLESDINVIAVDRADLDLRAEEKVIGFLSAVKPDAVIVAAGLVGGIRSNDSLPVNFISENSAIALSVISASFKSNISKLMYLSSNCIYPRDASPPHKTIVIGSAPMEPTNEWYGFAKLLGMKLCEAYRKQYGMNYFSAIPTNTFGPNDSTKLGDGHVISDLIMKCLELSSSDSPRKKLELWGSGSPIREFLFVDDLADAITFLLKNYDGRETVNIGGGTRLTIKELATSVVGQIDPSIDVIFDSTSPDGAPARFLDNSILNEMGWRPSTPFNVGLSRTIDWYKSNVG